MKNKRDFKPDLKIVGMDKVSASRELQRQSRLRGSMG